MALPNTLVGSPLDERCNELREPGFLSLTVSIIILVGLLISYLPQHYRIITRGTAEGISPYFVLLGTTSATSGFANILTLPQSRQDVACCKVLDRFECVAGLLGIAQLGAQWVCFTFILLLFLAYFRYETANVPEEELAASPPPKPQVALMVGSLCLLHAVAVIAVTGVISIVDPDMLGYWANLLGVMAAALAAVQYVPQIWTTYHLKHVGSLSIPMMCIQTPGGFLFAASLFARFGWPGWSTWGIYLLTASMQGIVLFLGIYYEVLARRNGKLPQPLGPPRAAPNDTKSTLGNGSGRRRAPVRSRSGLGDVVDDDQPAPYTAHAQEFADTPEEFERLVQREEDYVRHESEPLLRPGGIGDPHGYGGKPPPSKGPSRRYGGTDEQGSGS